MNKHECAVIMAYTGIITLTGDDMKYFYEYIAQLTGCPCTPEHVKAYPKELRKEKAKSDFVQLCRTATETDAEAVLKNRLKHLLQSDYIRQFDEKDPKTGTYIRDIKTATGAVQQQHGRWIVNCRNPDYVDCTNCGLSEWIGANGSRACAETILSGFKKYCPNCGARMDGGADNANT